jgi:hypothetical protein
MTDISNHPPVVCFLSGFGPGHPPQTWRFTKISRSAATTPTTRVLARTSLGHNCLRHGTGPCFLSRHGTLVKTAVWRRCWAKRCSGWAGGRRCGSTPTVGPRREDLDVRFPVSGGRTNSKPRRPNRKRRLFDDRGGHQRRFGARKIQSGLQESRTGQPSQTPTLENDAWPRSSRLVLFVAAESQHHGIAVLVARAAIASRD